MQKKYSKTFGIWPCAIIYSITIKYREYVQLYHHILFIYYCGFFYWFTILNYHLFNIASRLDSEKLLNLTPDSNAYRLTEAKQYIFQYVLVSLFLNICVNSEKKTLQQYSVSNRNDIYISLNRLRQMDFIFDWIF